MVADLVFDTRTLIVRRGGLRVLELLMRASPAVVRSAAVERTIWDDSQYLVKRINERIGWRVEVSSTPGVGTRFELHFAD